MPKAIKGVEIFSAGTWNGDAYTTDDLHEMVRAFDENSVGARPHLKVGHDPKQVYAKQILGAKDGAPACGWIEKLYVVGEKLVADFMDIPEKLYSLIEKRAYRKVSSEIFHNITIGEKKYGKMLAAVALLGADNPGVMNLADIMSFYSQKCDKLTINEFDFKSEEQQEREEPMPKTEAELREEIEAKVRAELEAKEAERKEFAAKVAKTEDEKAALAKENAELKEFKAKAEKEKIEAEAKAEEARIAAFTTQLVSDKLCTPSMKPLVEALLGPEKKEFSVKINKEEKKLSKEELLKETLKLFKAASEVNFEENSSTGDDKDKDDNADELDKKAKEYAAKHKVGYGQALKAVMSEAQA